jgi:hypothetical protein
LLVTLGAEYVFYHVRRTVFTVVDSHHVEVNPITFAVIPGAANVPVSRVI